MNGKRPSYQFRDYKALECKAFVDFIDEECWQRLHECSDVDVHARTLDSVLRDGLDKFARCSTRLTSTAKSKSYKYDRSVAEAKAIRRKFGTKLNQIKSNQVVDKQLLKAQRYRVRKLALKSQGRHIRRKIERGGTKQCFKSFEELTIIRNDKLPTGYDNDILLAESFSTFFYGQGRQNSEGVCCRK